MNNILFIVILAVLVIALIYFKRSTYRFYFTRVMDLEKSRKGKSDEVITLKDLDHLPDPVKKYLELVGVVGTPKVEKFSVQITGEMKMTRDGEWQEVLAEQVSYINNPVRLFFISMVHKGLKVVGLHHYENAEASMVIKVLDFFKVTDIRGKEMNRGETVTVFNDICIMAPGALINSNLTWREIDTLTAEGTFTNGEIQVTAKLFFNEKGELVNFISDDRCYLAENGEIKFIRWSTPVGRYENRDGLYLPTYGEAIWHMDDGEYKYAKFSILSN